MYLVFADAGIPMLFFHLPAMVLALMPVIVAEWWVARRQYGIGKLQALKGVVVANCFSTILGFPLFWALGVVVLAIAGPHIERSLPASWAIARRVFESGAGAIWLGPEVTETQVLQAGLIMLPAAFFVSVYAERWMLRAIWLDVPPRVTSRFTWYAHLISYPVLIVVWLVYVAAIW